MRERGLEERVMHVSREKEAADLRISTLERRLVETEKEIAMRQQNEEVLSGYVQVRICPVPTAGCFWRIAVCWRYENATTVWPILSVQIHFGRPQGSS